MSGPGESEASGPPDRRRRRALLVLLTAVLVVGGVELGALLVAPFAPELPRLPSQATRGLSEEDRELSSRLQSRESLHPYLGFVHNPDGNLRPERKLSDDGREYGFLWNREPIFGTGESDELVVAVVGGSVAVQIADGGASLLRQALRRIPRFADRPVRLVVLAKGGYRQPQQLLTLSYFLSLGASFDLVINLDGFNEVALPQPHNVERGVNLFFPRHWDLRVTGYDEARTRAAGLFTYLSEQRLNARESFTSSPLRFSQVAWLVHRVRDARRGERLQALRIRLSEWSLRDDDGVLPYQARGPASTTQSPAIYSELAANWYQSSLLIDRLLSGVGTQYVHFLQPNQYDVDAKPLSREEQAAAYDAEHIYRPGVIAGYPLLRERGADLLREGVRFYDLSRLFVDIPATVYRDDCCHFNVAGITAIVDAMAAAIEAL